MPDELLVLLLAWAATVSLLVVVPWAVVRLTVGVLEADVSRRGVERARPHQQSDTAVVTSSRESEERVDSEDVVPQVDSGDVVPQATTPDADADSADR